METWWPTCLLLCATGLLKELRPSEPFITEFLTGPWKNLTIDQVVQDVYPVWTYSYLALLVLVFVLTHYLLYKPVVVLEGLCYVSTWCSLIWGQGVAAMQGVEFLYAAATAARVAYTTYIYTQVPTDRFQLVTAYTKAALLTGRCLAGILGQVLISTGLCDYSDLNYISLGFVSSATLTSCFLPGVSKSIYFQQRSSPNTLLDKDGEGTLRLLWLDFSAAFSNPELLKWSLWWAVATCGYFQVVNYIQPLWETVGDGQPDEVYNGGVQALHTLLSALATLAVGYVPVDWSVYGETAISIISLFEGVMLFVSSSTQSLWIAYSSYIAFCVSYSVLITIASSEVAKGLKRESYGLVFGTNTFLALLFQTVLTLAVTDSIGLALNPRQQFKVYGGYYVVLGAIFLAMSSWQKVFGRKKKILEQETCANTQ